MENATLAQILQSMTVTQSFSDVPGLRDLAHAAQITDGKYTKKAELIAGLLAYYETAFSAKEIYVKLSEPEQVVATRLARTGGEIDPDEILEIVRQYNLTKIGKQSSFYYSYSENVRLTEYIPAQSPFWLLFPKQTTPSPLREQLLAHVGEMPRGEPLATLPNDVVRIEREGRLGDYRTLVQVCNRGDFAMTKTGLPGKSAMVGFWKEAGYREVTDPFSQNAADASTVKKMRVSFALHLTAYAVGLIEAKADRSIPGALAADLLSRPVEVIAKKLFEAYQTSSRVREISYLPGVRERYSQIAYPRARAFVAELLCEYTVGEWFSTDDFLDYVRAKNRRFLRTDAYEICYSGGQGYVCSWEDAEKPLLYFLLSVYGAIGLLDLAWAPRLLIVPNPEDRKQTEQSIPACFRITELGAYAFGLKARYQSAAPRQKKRPGGFLVQPDFSLMLPESVSRLGHELYLERFLTKVSTDAQMSVYRIDIDGILRLLNLGITVAELLSYLEQGAENPLPDAVRRAFADWQEMEGKLRIRTVTILETDDPILLEEVVRYRGMEQLVQGRTSYGAVIRPADTKKVKAILEKNKRYCDDGKKR